ncbi:hypothetical protein PR048_011573 [Dryococelus australis]|uniref:Uncharacterized protein n=1 Tax=Dryococelus australis TaxID=614101 RepID=A0ABQ9HLY2_9NEOP|nr:hypothetical protein PR048_011573 [Dryococelus australis]
MTSDVTLQAYRNPKLVQNIDSNIVSSSLIESQISPTSTSNVKKLNLENSSGNVGLFREEKLFMFSSSGLNKEFCLIFSNVLPAFEKPYVILY